MDKKVLTRAGVEELHRQDSPEWEMVPPDVKRAVWEVADEILDRWPEGWELRPREPSSEMINATGSGGAWQDVAKEHWITMWESEGGWN